jgi:hypothetical protein
MARGPVLISEALVMLLLFSSRENNRSCLQGRGFSVWSFPHALPAPHGSDVDTVDQ